jgi:hypothetical protein
MTYAKNYKIQASDYNNFVGTSIGNNINTVMGTGFGNYGYGQNIMPFIAEGSTVNHSEWETLRTNIANVATHQGSTISTVPSFDTGDLVEYVSALSTNLTTISDRRLYAASQGTSIPTSTSLTSTWNNYAGFTHIVTFQSADRARYFFNAGGQLAINFTQPGSTAIDGIWNGLINKIGTLVISAGSPASTNTVNVAGTAYTGFQQISSSPYATIGRSIYKPNFGYYAMTTGSTEVFRQTGGNTAATSGYNQSFISVKVRTNGPQGMSGDNGSTITITTSWSENPGGLSTSIGSAVTVTVRPPSTSVLANTWGTVNVVGTGYSG